MNGPVICIGAAFVDELLHTTERIRQATTTPASLSRTAGGVARNIAHHLALLKVPVQLISVFGDDPDGEWLKRQCETTGIGLDAALFIQGPSGKYTGILHPDGALFAAFLTHAATERITPEHLDGKRALLETASFLLADANTSLPSIQWLMRFSRETGIPFIIEPVSVPPAARLKSADLEGLYLVTPNEDELPAMCSEKATTFSDEVDELLSKGIRKIWLHNGARGSTIYSREKTFSLHARATQVVDCTGAGDSSLAGFLLGKYLGMDDEDALRVAHTLAARILQVEGSIDASLTRQSLLEMVPQYFPKS